MKTQESPEEAQKGKSLKRFHFEAGSTGIEEAGNAYQSASMVAAGAGYQSVGVLSSLTNLVAAFLYLRVPSVIRLLGSHKRAALVLALLNSLTWVPIIVVLLVLGRVSPHWFILLWVVNLVPGMMLGLARTNWIVGLTKAEGRGKYLGLRASIMNATYLTSFYALGYVLYLFSGERIFFGFAAIFFMAFLATVFSFFMYSRITDLPAPKDSSPGLLDFLGEMNRRNLARFILFASLFSLTVYLAAPFFAVYMLKDLRFGYIIFATVASSELVAKIIAMPFWGKYADRVGNLKPLRIISLALPLLPILWLVSHNVVYLVLVQLLSGIMWAGFDLCIPNFIYRSASPEKRLHYVLYFKTLTTCSMALGTLIAVFLVGRITPILGSQILSLFLLSGLLRFVVVVALFPKLREVTRGKQVYYEKPAKVPTLAGALLNQGLLYRPRQWFASPSVMGPRAQKAIAEVTNRLGLLYRPREWQWFSKPLAPAVSVAGVGPRRGLLYRPRDWRFLQTGGQVAPVACGGRAEVSVNRGIFYRPQHWALFARQS